MQINNFSINFEMCRCVCSCGISVCMLQLWFVSKRMQLKGELHQDFPRDRAWSNLAVIKIGLKPTPRLDFIAYFLNNGRH